MSRERTGHLQLIEAKKMKSLTKYQSLGMTREKTGHLPSYIEGKMKSLTTK